MSNISRRKMSIIISIMSNISRRADIVVSVSINIAYDVTRRKIRGSSWEIGIMTIICIITVVRSIISSISSITSMNIIIIIC